MNRVTRSARVGAAKVPVLMLHGLCENIPDYAQFEGGRTYLLPVEAFADLLRWCRLRFDIIRLSELADAVKSGARCRPLLLTFDDALASVIDHAIPILRAHGESALTFVTTDWTDGRSTPFVFQLERLVYERQPVRVGIDVPGHRADFAAGSRCRTGALLSELWTWLFANRVAPLSLRPDHVTLDGAPAAGMEVEVNRDFWFPATWDELRTAAAGGCLEIGSHMTTHTPLAWLDEEALTAELLGSRDRLAKEFRCPITSCAYPHGSNSPLARQVAADVFEWSFAGRGGVVTSRSEAASAPRMHVPSEGWQRVARDLTVGRWDPTGLGVTMLHGMDAAIRKARRLMRPH